MIDFVWFRAGGLPLPVCNELSIRFHPSGQGCARRHLTVLAGLWLKEKLIENQQVIPYSAIMSYLFDNYIFLHQPVQLVTVIVLANVEVRLGFDKPFPLGAGDVEVTDCLFFA